MTGPSIKQRTYNFNTGTGRNYIVSLIWKIDVLQQNRIFSIDVRKILRSPPLHFKISYILSSKTRKKEDTFHWWWVVKRNVFTDVDFLKNVRLSQQYKTYSCQRTPSDIPTQLKTDLVNITPAGQFSREFSIYEENAR